MSDAKIMHREAMELSDAALIQRLRGNSIAARRLFEAAFEKELAVAEIFQNQADSEPTRSIVLRSAATLAQDCGQLSESERLIHVALSGRPPESIAVELRGLLDEVTFQRHLELNEIELTNDELQLALTGEDVGYGIAPAEIFSSCIRNVESLLYRTAERRREVPYRDSGRRSKALSNRVRVFMAVPRAACFAVTLRIGGAAQRSFSGLSETEEVIDDLIDCLDFFATANEAALKERIGSEDYYRNFIGLAQALQPDGVSIKTVGLTTLRQGTSRSVALRGRTALEPKLGVVEVLGLPRRNSGDVETVAVEGRLLTADATKRSDKQSGVVEIVEDGGKKIKVTVPPGLMSDIVRPLWELRVAVTGIQRGKKIYLTQITEIADR